MAAVLLALVLLAACGGQKATSGGKAGATSTAVPPTATAIPKLAYRDGGPGDWYPFAQVAFTASTTPATALRTITDLGLQPANSCTYGESTIPWEAINLRYGLVDGPRSGDPPSIAVYATARPPNGQGIAALYVAPSDWPVQLVKLTNVMYVADQPVHCPLEPFDTTPVPGRIYYLDYAQTPTYIRVTFTTGTSYDQALATVSALGFRLADPCYEQAQAQPKPAWHSMGQESSFASTHSLLIATTGGNATTWHQQLVTASGVARVTAPYQPIC